MTIDLNADLGEGFGPWRMGDDAAMLAIVSSASIACGFHAGDPQIMRRTIAEASRRGVSVGAHPGFDDLKGFGRRVPRQLDLDELGADLAYQIGAFAGVAALAGLAPRHVKLHGALSNLAAVDDDLALALGSVIRSVDPALIWLVPATSAMQRAATALGIAHACEIFADRAYAADGSLAPRTQPGAVIHDPEVAAARVLRMLASGALETPIGRLPTPIDSICVHGDTPGAVAMARDLRTALTEAGYRVAPFAARPAAGQLGSATASASVSTGVAETSRA